MHWLDKIISEITTKSPDGEILIQSGASPSGSYHFGHLREAIISDAVVLELNRLGRKAKHVHFVDDLDALRKIPANIAGDYEQYLGVPLCDVPAPNGGQGSYSEFFVAGLISALKYLGIEVEFIYSHEKYRSGFFVPAIEQVLEDLNDVRKSLETISQRDLGENWTPIQVMEEGKLKNRKFISIDPKSEVISYVDAKGSNQTVSYARGEVKLDWRLDWPARWWLLKVDAEAFGRDHATKGGSYDTGAEISAKVFKNNPPVPIPYDFVNRSGDPKKMSSSRGTGVDINEIIKVLPAEVIRYFMLRFGPEKRLYFDSEGGVVKLIDEFAELVAKTDKTEDEKRLLYLSTRGINDLTVSRVPFSHLVSSYQAALKDETKTLDIISRTEHALVVKDESETIKAELKFIDQWLKLWAPDDVKFDLLESVDPKKFNDTEKQFLSQLADKIASAPMDADGEWFHAAIYSFVDSLGLKPADLFKILYRALIDASSGPRAGWFLSMLPRDWLIKRLRLEV